MFDRLYPKRSHPKESACDHRYWKYISNGEDDAEKECFCDIDDDYCFGKGACGKERVMERCEWAVREGWGNSYWGNTPCKKGFNYLSKTNKVSQLKDCYENRLCPICGKPIKLKGYVFDDDFVEQW